MSVAASNFVISTQNAKPDFTRSTAAYHPSIWGDHFIQYASESCEVDDKMRQQIEALKELVGKMLVPGNEKPTTKLNLIDSIQRLGVSYHFENEIDQLLQQIHNSYVENGIIKILDGDLHSLALLFRLLRQQGYRISPVVFEKFKDDEGNFRERVTGDIEGMLSLHEAAQLRVHGEDILDEAAAFTSTRLESMVTQLSPPLATQVKYSLRHPLRKVLPRIAARQYISIYQQDPSHSDILLTLAKLDFNALQKLHQKEFGNICKWWKDFDVPRNLPYVRDRIVECCFWILSVYFEPQYSVARRMMTKVIAVLSIIDDTYDAYGTIQELELLTNAIERWDICCLDYLPESMTLPFGVLMGAFEEIEQEMKKEGRVGSVYYAKTEMKKTVQAYMTEARWLQDNYVPTTEEYIGISTISCCYPLLTTVSLLGMGDMATEDVFKWVTAHPKIVKASAKICRLMDDIVSNEFEQKRGHVASVLECHMKEHGVSREVARNEVEKLISNGWKDINEECLGRPTKIAMPLLMRVVNLARFIDVFYKDEDNYTHSGGIMKDYIAALLVDPLSL